MARNSRAWALRAALLGGLLSCAFDWPQRTARILTELERTRDPVVRADLVRLLGQRPDDEAEQALTALLDDPAPALRREAARALGRRHDAGPEQALVKALTDSEATVRRAAADALGQLGFEQSVPALLRALGDASSETRAAAVRALGTILPKSGASAERAALTPIAVALDDDAPEVRTAAARALAGIAPQEALGALLAKLHDPAPEMRATALSLLATLDRDHIEPLLLPLLDDANEPVQLEALRVLATVPKPLQAETTQRLEALEHRARPQISAAARVLLHKSPPPPSEPEWIAMLARTEHADAESSEFLLAALERSLPAGEPLAVDPLALWFARAPRELRGRIAALIAQANPVQCGGLMSMLDDGDASVRLAAVRIAGTCRFPVTVPALFRRLDDEAMEVARSAAVTLGKKCDPAVLVALEEAARAAETSARKADEQPPENRARSLTRALVGCLAHVAPSALPERPRRALEQRLHSQLDEGDTDLELASLSARALGRFPSDTTFAHLRRNYETASLPLRVAILRAGVRDRSPEAQALRAAASKAPQPALAISGRLAAWLAHDPGLAPDERLGGQGGQDLPWPLGPLEAFLLASTPVSQGRESSTASEASLRTRGQQAILCAALHAAEPITRQNARVGLARSTSSNEPGAFVDPACAAISVQRVSAPRHAGRGVSPPEEQPRTPGSFHALSLPDGRVLISVADGSGDVSWPDLPHIVTENPWHRPYGTE